MNRVLAIIRINSKALGDELEDLERFGRVGLKNLRFRIPKVTVLKRAVQGAHEFEEKPLLFNYGFLELPLEYARTHNKLQEINRHSRLLQGFFYRTEDALKLERVQAKADGLSRWRPILVKTITSEEIDILTEVALSLNVYDNPEELGVGSFIMLKGYPFDGLSAEIVRKKTNGKIQVKLLDSGMVVWLEQDNVYYSVYAGDTYMD